MGPPGPVGLQGPPGPSSPLVVSRGEEGPTLIEDYGGSTGKRYRLATVSVTVAAASQVFLNAEVMVDEIDYGGCGFQARGSLRLLDRQSGEESIISLPVVPKPNGNGVRAQITHLAVFAASPGAHSYSMDVAVSGCTVGFQQWDFLNTILVATVHSEA
ncbi:MAG: hypothetical protein ABR507_09125 [Actinomycetota bacterium]